MATARAPRIDTHPTQGRAALFHSSWLLLGAPVVAILAGIAAEWLDFRALRYPLLLMVGAGVLATAYALFGSERTLRAFVAAMVLGAATWAAAETLYVVIHTIRGEPFDAERFGPQWAQALGLIGVHALFLGVPTGIAAGIARYANARFPR